MKYHVSHRTTYEYSEPVTVSHHAARVEPRATRWQTVDRWDLRISPEPAVRRMRQDFFGNSLCFFSVQELHQRLEIVGESEVRLVSPASAAAAGGPSWEKVVAAMRDPSASEHLEAQQFVFESPHVRPSPDLARYAGPSFTPGRPLLDAMRELNQRIHEEFVFDSEATTVATPLEAVLKEGRGVCQDFTHLALGCVRSMGLAGRYVSGYIRTYPAESEASLVGADASHAWFSVFCPGSGWVDFDPTNDLSPGLDHIAVAYGRDFSDVSPVTGIIVGGGEHRVHVAVKVEPQS